MRMNGSWHIYRPGERWQRPASRHAGPGRDRATSRRSDSTFRSRSSSAPGTSSGTRSCAGSGPTSCRTPSRPRRRIRRLQERARRRRSPTRCSISACSPASATSTSRKCSSCAASIRSRPCARWTLAVLTSVVETARRVLKANVSEVLAPMTTYSGLRRTTGRDAPKERLWVYGRAVCPAGDAAHRSSSRSRGRTRG